MMTNFEQDKGILQVAVGANKPNWDNIPKQLQVLDAGLTLKQSSWIESNTSDHELTPGAYLIRLNLPSGSQLEQVAQIYKDQVTTLDFDVSQFSPRKNQEWMYLTKGNAGDNPLNSLLKMTVEQSSVKQPIVISTRRWQLDNFVWKSTDDIPIHNAFIDEIGETYIFSVPQAMQILEIIVPGKTSCFACLPPSDEVKCMIKIAAGPESVVPQLDISISTSNEKAQALLSLITSGDMSRAKTLASVGDAELLLSSKKADPASAAIGGYFLLKTGELARMHDWATNLANWFPWMPDGSIIHAWQMIQLGSVDINFIYIIRKRFLDAVNMGVPIYTEGIRLLYDGLNMLSNEFKQEDNEVEQALKRIKQYITYTDMSQETTTYTGTYPDEPGADKNEGDDRARTVPPIN